PKTVALRPIAAVVLALSLSGFVAAADVPTFQLTAKDGRFAPDTLEVPAGKKFKLIVNNEGPGPEEFESHELNREKVIPAGQKAEIFLGPLKAGTYGFFGEFHPQTAKGQIVAK
ncbi:MAG: cupredoxin domain-containing protein, partial [Sulfurifustis sp.]